MEIEMKYSIPNKECAERIWDDEYLLGIGDLDTRDTRLMKAVYFDTEDYVLTKNQTTFRIRLEGDRLMATTKWDGSFEDGCHMREEINVPVTEESYLMNPPADLFSESIQGEEISKLIGNRSLHNMLETRFLRRRMRVDSGDAIFELAIDTGEVVTDFGNLPICEMELELFSGEADELKRIGEKLAEAYGLLPEETSKFSRGLHLLQQGMKK